MPDQPQPVYIVDPPPAPHPWWRRWQVPAAVLGAMVIVGLAVAPRDQGPRVSSEPPGSQPAPSITRSAVLSAGDAILDALEATISAKDASCSTLTGSRYTKCTAEYDQLSAQWSRLEACFEDAQIMADLAACERAVGYQP